VNPLLVKENPHKEHEGHKRLLVSTAFHKRSVGYRREIVFLARWLAEVHEDPAPVFISVCVLLIEDQGVKKQIRRFGTMTSDLLELKLWLQQLGVTHVAMESTGVYWKPCGIY
jgi:hypothetical protein